MTGTERVDPAPPVEAAPPGDPADRTGRARIRDAALAEFAAHGVAGATLREIARSAGVTAGLVRHHFGSKEGLREACDAYVVATVRRETDRMFHEGGIGDRDVLAALFASAPGLMAYVARSLTEGGPAGAALFDAMVATAEAYLAELPAPADPDAADVHTRAAVLTAMKLGVTVLGDHLQRSLGLPSEQALPRVARAALDLLAPEVMDPAAAEQARKGLSAYTHHPEEGTTR